MGGALEIGRVSLRAPRPEDADAIGAIDAQGLATGHATFRDTPHNWSSFQAGYLTGRGLALVAEDAAGVAAWAGVSPTSARPVYAGVGEVSIYVAAERHGTGIGRKLLAGLIAASEQAGYWTLVAQIFPENEASLALHAATDFLPVGTRRRLGRMTYGPLEGHWRDVVMLERRSPVTG
ncbi:MAG: GNAT family N-acetyltransferase [Alphaproteobacteria bacterium]|nr:GNAT family N-acetyltransferase [Alphaproteobacteria bacterium]